MDSSSSATPGRPPVRQNTSQASSEASSEAASVSSLLKQGLTALADQKLDRAIALLTAVLDESPPSAIRRRALVGLVKAYQRQGDRVNAIACCQPLLNSSHDPTRRWGRRAVTALHKATAPAEDADITGFVPLDGTAAPLPTADAVPAAEPTPEPVSAPVAKPSPSPSPAPPQRTIAERQTTPKPASALPWRQASRAMRWAPLPPPPKIEQAVVSIWTVVSLVALSSGLLQLVMALGNPVRRFVGRFMIVSRWRFLEDHPTAVVAVAVLVLWALSPWLLQVILWRQGAKPLTLERLTQMNSTAGRLIRDQPHSPRLHILPIRAPILLSYGLHPRLSWLVVSDGLRQMNDDEVAVLVAAELAHLQSPATACLTLAIAASQLPYALYWSIAAWGDRQSIGVLRGLAVAVSALCYGLYQLFCWPGAWLSRWRLWRSDRLAISTTGHPNGLARALVNLSIAITAERRRDPDLGLLLEGFAPLLPVSPEAALPLESLARRPLSEAEFYAALRRHLQWPCPAQFRRWLTLNHSHPPLDGRLRSLMAIAAQWRLEPEIRALNHPPQAISRSDMLLQASPYWGPILGAGLALILWTVGGVAGRQSPLGWLWGDRAILYGLAAIGASMGLLARINRYFPDIPRTLTPEQVDLSALRGTLGAPVQAVPVILQGRLLGRRGLLNALGQDLLLDTSDGLVRLSFFSALGPVGNLILGSPPHGVIGRTVTVTGWRHQGATDWVDANRISANGKPGCKANHPIWSTVVATGLALWGAWTIYWGS